MNKLDNYDTLHKQVVKNSRVHVKDTFLEGDITVMFRSTTSRELKAYHTYSHQDIPQFYKHQLKTIMYVSGFTMDDSTIVFPSLSDKLDNYPDNQYEYRDKVNQAAEDAISVLDFMDETIYNICERAANNFKECIDQFVKTAVTGDFISGFSREDYQKYVVKDEKN